MDFREWVVGGGLRGVGSGGVGSGGVKASRSGIEELCIPSQFKFPLMLLILLKLLKPKCFAELLVHLWTDLSCLLLQDLPEFSWPGQQ